MSKQSKVKNIPVDQIRVINPRARNKKKYKEIVDSISKLGLKRPIVISRRSEVKDDDCYDLVCGQGRLQAFIELGHTEIPAIVVDIAREERLLMSLVENLARRNPPTIEMIRQVEVLRDRGYNNSEIARKIGADNTWVGGVLRLLDNGEERLLLAVEKGEIPLGVAIKIASVSEGDIQKALREAYEKDELRGQSFLRARKVIEKRTLYGKTGRCQKKGVSGTITSDTVVRAYKKEAQRQQVMVKKAKLCEGQLLFIANALRQLFANENFSNLMKAEKLDTVPSYLAEKIWR